MICWRNTMFNFVCSLAKSGWLFPLVVLVLLCGCSPSGAQEPSQASPTPPSTAHTAFMSYVGKWQVHGSFLTIHAQRTGLETWNAGPCTQSTTETRLCNGNATMTFTVNADGSIKGTIQSVWYTQWNGEPAPAGFQSDPENPQASDTFELQHREAHLLYTTWFGRLSKFNSYNQYWCDSSTSPADRPLCGA